MSNQAILSGREPADKILNQIKQQLETILKQDATARTPMFAIIQIGDNPASNIYIANKKRVAEQLGFDVLHHKFADDVEIEIVEATIDSLNEDEFVDGIIMQLPVAGRYRHLLDKIAAHKDIDGLGKMQQANLVLNRDGLKPCTPLGVIKMMEHYSIPFETNTCIVGRSILVGQSLALMLLQHNATVTVVHHKTPDIAPHIKNADIVFLAAGCPGLVESHMLKKDAIVIDIAITAVENKVVGDYTHDATSTQNSHIKYSPVPGGVGPMTIACLMHNVFKAYKENRS